MGHRYNQIDMTYPVSSYFFLRYFNTTTVTNNSFVTDSFIFTAGTFIILYRTKDSFTE